MYHYSCNHFLENRERSVCTVTALAVDETGIAAALGSSGRVRKIDGEQRNGGSCRVERLKRWQRRDGSLVE